MAAVPGSPPADAPPLPEAALRRIGAAVAAAAGAGAEVLPELRDPRRVGNLGGAERALPCSFRTVLSVRLCTKIDLRLSYGVSGQKGSMGWILHAGPTFEEADALSAETPGEVSAEMRAVLDWSHLMLCDGVSEALADAALNDESWEAMRAIYAAYRPPEEGKHTVFAPPRR
jgi:hypothetical protein